MEVKLLDIHINWKNRLMIMILVLTMLNATENYREIRPKFWCLDLVNGP